MMDISSEVRHAFRTLLWSPTFTAVSILTLAIGIGATTAAYSVAASVLNARVPVRNAERVLALWSFDRVNGSPRVVVSKADFETWRARQRTFEDLSAALFGGVNLSGIDEPVRATSAFVSASYFDVVGITPALGRPFTAAENAPGAGRVAILNERIWRVRFGRRPDVIGSTIAVDGRATTVVGVMPADDFTPEILLPLTLDPAAADYSQRALLVAGRLRAGVTEAQARADMQGIAQALERERPGTSRGWGINVFPYREEFIGRDEPLIMAFLGGTAIAVLLIGCINIANLLLARGATRTREFAIRSALGASWARLTRQTLVESLILALISGVAGLFVAYGALRLLMVTFFPDPPVFMQDRYLDQNAWWTALTASLGATLVFGVLPALHHGRVRANPLLDGARNTVSRGLDRLRGAFVAGEVALAVLLLVTTLLISRSFLNLLAIDPGFDPRNVLLMQVSLPVDSYAPEEAMAFYEGVRSRLAATPGVARVGAASRVPVAGSRLNPSRPITIEGLPALEGQTRSVDDLTVTSGYLETLGAPLRTGRLPTAADGPAAPLVVVVSEAAARRLWGAASPLGGRIRLGDEPALDAWRTVIGVVGDIRNDDIDAPPPPYVYVPAAQRSVPEMTFMIRAAGNPLALVGAARAAVAEEDASLAVYNVRTMEQVLAEDLQGPAMLSSMIAVFGGIALALAALGIYGTVAYVVANRTREIGIRLAIGARGHQVARHVFGRSLAWVTGGLAVGLVAALGTSRLLAATLFGVAATDPLTYITVMGLLLVVAALACVVPLRHMVGLDPVMALRVD